MNEDEIEMSSSTAGKVPFSVTATLSPIVTDHTDCVPGQPNVSLDRNEVDAFLAQELDTPTLDELYPRLWLVGKKSGASIDPLHEQRVKGRQIVPVENPQLHLAWRHNKFYVKPLPEYLLSHSFWTSHLSYDGDKLDQADDHNTGIKNKHHLLAVGFVRSYAHLIRHRSDFILAHDHHLLPENVHWDAWCRFIRYFQDLEDTRVAKRYHYGQLRLSRLDWAVRLFRPPSARTGWWYEVPYWSIQTYMQRIAAPLIFGFASVSLTLSSMQVLLSSPLIADDPGIMSVDAVRSMSWAFWVFSIAILVLSATIWVLLLVMPLAMLMWQISWGFKNRGAEVTRSTIGV